MTKKTRTADRSRRETQRKSGSSGKLGKKSVTSKDRVVQASKKRSDSTEEPEENGVDQECLDTSDVAAVDDDVSKEKLATHEDAQDNVIQRPTFNIKQGDFVQLTVEMASRLLHANPCCFLTTTTTASGENTCKAPASLNAMTLSWLTPANNYGGFVFVIHKTRFSASRIVNGSGKFTLSVAHAGLRDVLLACGKVTGRIANKFDGSVEGLKAVTSSKLCASNEEQKSFTARNAFSALCNDSDSGSDSDSDGNGNADTSGKVDTSSKLDSNATAPPIQGTVAHLSCRVVQHSDAADAGHWLVTAQIEDAFVHTSYWDGKCFEPKLPDLPPLVSFLGSQRFGFVVAEE